MFRCDLEHFRLSMGQRDGGVMKGKRVFILCSMLLLLCRGGSAASVKIKGWWVDSLVKVFPGDRPVTSKSRISEYAAARNGHANIQLAVRAAADVPGITARIAPAPGETGEIFKNAVVRQVGYVVVGSHSTDTPERELVGETPGWYPDVLLPLPGALQARKTAAFWITVPVPAGTSPGMYQGTIQLQSGGKDLLSRAFRLRVYAATVPEKRSLKVTNWFAVDDRHTRQFFKAPQYSPEWWDLLGNLARVMADYRQNVIITPIHELVRPFVAEGELRYDFANFDRWVETFEKAGALDWIEGRHLMGRAGAYNEPLRVSVFALQNGEAKVIGLPPDDPQAEPAMARFLQALDRHLQEKQWKAKYLQHILDEPHGNEPPYYGRVGEWVRRYLPGVRTIDAIDATHVPPEVEQYCDIWVPLLGRFDDRVDDLGKRIQSGKEVWLYTCLFPRGSYMNRLIDFPLVKTRLLHWADFRYNLTGFLHWGWDKWTPDPIKATQPVINMNATLLPAGDAFIVYPDRAGKTVQSSIRLEAMREGIEDYELLRELERGNAEAAHKLAEAMVRSFTDYVREPAQFRRIHRELLEAFEIKVKAMD
jgi:hypothetical protein